MSDSPLTTREPGTTDLVERRVQPSWNELGESFETMGKLSLALAVGLSAAGLFCKLADQGKVKIPTLSSLMTSRPEPASRNGKATQSQS